ncbi:MAG: 30S ribosomal protein S1 [Candidatus Krumholzibacteriia bacterium]
MFEHDDDEADSPDGTAGNDAGEFARLLAGERVEAARPEPRPGEKVNGTIIQIGDTEAFVDCGGRAELPIALRELQNDKGELTYALGSPITAWVRIDGERQYLSIAGHARGRDTAPIEEAHRSGMPLTGIVRETNKGGFVVDLGGHRAFCPISQIDAHFVEDPLRFVGQTLQFRVVEFGAGGRSIVVSRRAILREEIEARAAETRRTLQTGNVREGTVCRLMTFGAFVDIGGIEGLVHVSEISHEHVESPLAVLRPGQTVQVKVIGIQNLGQGKAERISLSMKALEGDPWQDAARTLQPGTDHAGTVRRLTDFGAFVELLPGVQGLVHVSELATARIRHPRDVVREGEAVTVRILECDPDRKRISLSLKQAGGDDADADDADEAPPEA